MAIDPNILPQMGTYKGLKYSKRYSDLIPNQAGFVQTDAETGRKSWYQGNAFTTYVGGEGILASSWERVIYANTLISCSPAAEEHPVNISMAVMDTAGTLRSGSIRTTGGGSSYIPGYSCPVLDFDATKICIAIRIYVADIGGSDPESEGWTTTELDLKAIMTNNPTYAGLFEKGYTEDGKFLVGFTPLFYIDGGSGRAYDGRISLVVENSAPGRDSWNTLENIYFFFGF